MKKFLFLSMCSLFMLAAVPGEAKESGNATGATATQKAADKKAAPQKAAPKKSTGKKAATKKPKAKPHAKNSRRNAQAVSAQEKVEDDAGGPNLRSASALVIDQDSGEILIEKNAGVQAPIASITKLMTAMVVLDAQPDMLEELDISAEDAAWGRSRLPVGTRLTREALLRLALMSSENRAASSLSRHYPGGREAFVAAMNNKAADLGLVETHFTDPTGLSPDNVSSARDLTGIVNAAHSYPEIRAFSTEASYAVSLNSGREVVFHNTNQLVSSDTWEIGLSKTGYIHEAGKCLVMQAKLNDRSLIIVLLDSWGELTRIGDANRIRLWLEKHPALAQRQEPGDA